MQQIIPALILAVGAFYGVWKGAVYAVGRLSAQMDEERRLSEERLTAEAERVQMQLEAESQRLERQLEHDREMRDRDALREFLDEGVKLAFEAGDIAQDFERRLALPPPRPPESRPLLVGRQLEAALAMAQYWHRLMIRYPVKNEVSASFTAVMTTFNKATASANALLMDEKVDADGSVKKALDEQVLHARSVFLNACQLQVGVMSASHRDGALSRSERG